jgi:bifunctional non-homologous end joining protein LigD
MESETSHRAFRERAYAMKKHLATRLHYDLRLAWNGVVLSWAIPAGPGCCAGVIREAIEMKDHRVANLLFEGVHETGPIMLWDRGTWEPYPDSADIESSLRRGILRFTLRGEKLKGDWTLVRTGRRQGDRQDPIWLLSKDDDEFARASNEPDILKEAPDSVLTGRSLEEIAQEWTTGKRKSTSQAGLFDDIPDDK